jgi:hypothetical protein
MDMAHRRLLGLTAAAAGAAGYWPNVDENATRVQSMIQFLKNLGY